MKKINLTILLFTCTIYVCKSQGIGINTSSPKSMLDVEGNLAVGATYSGTTAAPTNGAIIEGDVGIGTTLPGSTLHILENNATDGNTVKSVAYVERGYSSGTGADGIGGQLDFRIETETESTYETIGQIGAVTTDATATTVEGDLVFNTADASTLSEKMRITSDGKVGVGTTAPVGQLEVYFPVTDPGATSPDAVWGLTEVTLTANNTQRARGVKGELIINQNGFNATNNNLVANAGTAIAEGASGTITWLSGVRGRVLNTGAGTITNAAALIANSAINSGGGTVTNAYGLYLREQTVGTNNWEIYAVGSSPSYINGNLGLGVTAPDTELHIDGVQTMEEVTSTPADPDAGTEGRIYIKGDKLVVQFKDGLTTRYKYLDLTGTGVTWTHTTTAP